MPGVFSRDRALSVGRKIRTRISRSEEGIILFSMVCNFRAAMLVLRIPEAFLLRVIYCQKAEGSEEKSPDAYSGDAMRSMAEGLLLPAFRSTNPRFLQQILSCKRLLPLVVEDASSGWREMPDQSGAL